MQNIDKVRVNGTEYGISSGGEMPVMAYEGAYDCGIAEFRRGYRYVPDDGETFSPVYPIFYLRRTGQCGDYEYDMVVMCEENDYYGDSQPNIL